MQFNNIKCKVIFWWYTVTNCDRTFKLAFAKCGLFLLKCMVWLHWYLFPIRKTGKLLPFFTDLGLCLLAVQNERDRISCRRESQAMGTLTIDVLMQAEAFTQVSFLINLLSKHSHLWTIFLSFKTHFNTL